MQILAGEENGRDESNALAPRPTQKEETTWHRSVRARPQRGPGRRARLRERRQPTRAMASPPSPPSRNGTGGGGQLQSAVGAGGGYFGGAGSNHCALTSTSNGTTLPAAHVIRNADSLHRR